MSTTSYIPYLWFKLSYLAGRQPKRLASCCAILIVSFPETRAISHRLGTNPASLPSLLEEGSPGEQNIQWSNLTLRLSRSQRWFEVPRLIASHNPFSRPYLMLVVPQHYSFLRSSDDLRRSRFSNDSHYEHHLLYSYKLLPRVSRTSPNAHLPRNLK